MSAEGVRIEAPRAYGLGRGCPLPNRLGLGERRELSQRGPGPSLGRQRIFGILHARRTLLVERTVPTKPVFFGKKSIQSTIGGPWHPDPLWLRTWDD